MDGIVDNINKHYDGGKNKEKFYKMFSSTMNSAKELAKSKTCLLCGKDMYKPCNSHSVPEAVLKNIAEAECANANSLVGLPLIRGQEISKHTGVFHNICDDCDTNIFKGYENDNELRQITQEKLSQMVLKSYLKFIDTLNYLKPLASLDNIKWGKEYSTLWCDIERRNRIKDHILENNSRIKAYNMELQDLTDGLEMLKNNSIKCETELFDVFFEMELDYVVPIAFQSLIAVYFDFKNNIVNELFNTKSKTSYLCIVVFPGKTTSKILLYVNKGEQKYKNFISDFNKLTLDKKIEIINYLIFIYSNEFYLHPKVVDYIKNMKTFKSLEKIVKYLDKNKCPADISVKERTEQLRKLYSLRNITPIPNLLSKDIANNYK